MSERPSHIEQPTTSERSEYEVTFEAFQRATDEEKAALDQLVKLKGSENSEEWNRLAEAYEAARHKAQLAYEVWTAEIEKGLAREKEEFDKSF